MSAQLGRYKGSTIEALEHMLQNGQKLLDHLRKEGSDACLPPAMQNALHTMQTSLGKVYSTQHQARAFRDIKQLIERQ